MINIKKYKHIEDVIEDYIQVQNESLEIPIVLDKLQEKWHKLISAKPEHDNFSTDDAQDLFKIFLQRHKYQEKQEELDAEFAEVQDILKAFLTSINGKIEFERKEDHEKNKVTYLFWLENGQILSNR
jgi:hypothetical protein